MGSLAEGSYTGIKKDDIIMWRQSSLLICPLLLVNIATCSIITLNAAAHLPLIASGTAGGLSTVMAALGALKLGALTLLHADTIVDSLETKTRVARSAQSFGGGDQEALFQLVNSLDLYSCVKRLICELKAKPEDQAEYDLAVTVGSQGSAAACKESFSTRPFPGSVLMAAMAENGLSTKSEA